MSYKVKSYLSWSEINSYRQDPNQYYVDYIMGVSNPPNQRMVYGSVIHKALESDQTPEELEVVLKEKEFKKKDISIGKLLLSCPKGQGREVMLYVHHKDLECDLYLILDGLDITPTPRIIEYKTAGGYSWKAQSEVDKHGQLTLYATAFKLLYNIIPDISLYRLDTKNGEIIEWKTKREEQDIQNMITIINETVRELKVRKWWDRREMKDEKKIELAKLNVEKYGKQIHPNI